MVLLVSLELQVVACTRHLQSFCCQYGVKFLNWGVAPGTGVEYGAICWVFQVAIIFDAILFM